METMLSRSAIFRIQYDIPATEVNLERYTVEMLESAGLVVQVKNNGTVSVSFEKLTTTTLLYYNPRENASWRRKSTPYRLRVYCLLLSLVSSDIITLFVISTLDTPSFSTPIDIVNDPTNPTNPTFLSVDIIPTGLP